MNQTAIPLANARFWVRPYEFEGDGSHGAAENVATLEVGGKTRSFWLKTLENRLFFREVGRDETWNFGALEELESDDLPSELMRVLANENYGRVVLPCYPPRPYLYLIGPDGKFWFGSPLAGLHERGVWAPHKTNRPLSFIERPPGYFQTLVDADSEHAAERQQMMFAQLRGLPMPHVEPQWVVGSEQEWRRVVTALFHFWWPQWREEGEFKEVIEWQLWSACSMESMFLERMTIWGYWNTVSYASPPLRRRAQYLTEQFCWVGQGKTNEKSPRGAKLKFGPCALRGTVSVPTHHEILEAHLFLREWINERLPPAKARRWLDFL